MLKDIKLHWWVELFLIGKGPPVNVRVINLAYSIEL